MTRQTCQTCAHFINADYRQSAAFEYGFCAAAPSFRAPRQKNGAPAPMDNATLIHRGNVCAFSPSEFVRANGGRHE
jgi:hypothetical protein